VEKQLGGIRKSRAQGSKRAVDRTDRENSPMGLNRKKIGRGIINAKKSPEAEKRGGK